MLQLALKPWAFHVNYKHRLLQEKQLVQFSSRWPDRTGIEPGAVYRVDSRQEVGYDLHYIISPSDYKDLNLSDQEAGLKLYPTVNDHLYEIAVGLKDGNYLLHFHSPAGDYLYRLEYTGMSPRLDDPKQRYLGAMTPEDSPYDNPMLTIYTLRDMDPFFIRVYVDSGDYEKVVLGLTINRAILSKVETPTEEQKRVARYVPSIDEVGLRTA